MFAAGKGNVFLKKQKGLEMELKKLHHDFTVCKVKDFSETDLSQEFCFVGKTDEELSVVCLTERVPGNVTKREDGWKAFRIQGILDFSLIGILAKISAILAEHEIGIFVVSTFNTDYVLVKEDDYERALWALRAEGCQVVE